jgi:SAM-dependent methyltransferase
VISSNYKPPISLVKLAHSLIKDKVTSGDIVIDATVGNGHDTAFLLDLVKPSGKVFGFDIQQTAIDSTRVNLQDIPFIECLTLLHASHENMGEAIPTAHHRKISAVMFNLGYLPGGDKRIITQADSTLVALSSASQLLAADGIITVLAYPGHEGGEMETGRVKNWCLSLNPKHNQVKLFDNHPEKSAPKLFVVSKIR